MYTHLVQAAGSLNSTALAWRMQAPAPTAAGSDGLVELESILTASGLPKVPELIALFRRFHLLSRAAVSRCPALGDIVAQLFDMNDVLGRLECSGYLTTLQVRSAAMRSCPSAASLRSLASPRCSHPLCAVCQTALGQAAAVRAHEPVDQAKARPTFLPNTTPLRVEDLKALPQHIAAEAAALAKGRNERNLLTEFELRALVASSGIWLAVHGVTNKQEAPNVIAKWCQLLKDAGLTEGIFHKGERSTPISLETRVNRWLSDYIRRPAEDVPGPKGWRLEVAADAQLNTPMRDLEGKGRIRRMPVGQEPQGGHSAKSILGGGLAQSHSPVLCQASPLGQRTNDDFRQPMPAVPPAGTPPGQPPIGGCGGRPNAEDLLRLLNESRQAQGGSPIVDVSSTGGSTGHRQAAGQSTSGLHSLGEVDQADLNSGPARPPVGASAGGRAGRTGRGRGRTPHKPVVQPRKRRCAVIEDSSDEEEEEKQGPSPLPALSMCLLTHAQFALGL